MEETLQILLVDDDAVDRMAVKRALTKGGVRTEVVEADSCEVAIAQLQSHPFDCIFLDYYLPDGDALILINRVRQAGITVPMIVLTGQGDEQIAVDLMKAGVYDYFAKAKLAPEPLSRSLHNAVRIHRAEVQAAEATRRLQESEERYRLVLEGSNDGIWDWYICHNQVFCNDRLFEIIGISREELGTAYDAFYRLIHPDDRRRVLHAIRDHMEQSTPFDVEFRLWNVSGTYRYCTSRGKAQRDERGNLFRMSGIVSDITARKQTEAEIVKLNQALERRVEELQTLFDVIPIGIAIAEDAGCQSIRVNPAYSEMLGIRPADNAAIRTTDDPAPYRFYRDGAEIPLANLPMEIAATQGQPVRDTEFDILRQDQSLINVIGYTTPLFDEHGHSRGCVGAFLDITERKRIEAAQRFLTEASSLLAHSLDTRTILQTLANLAVPFLADACWFDLMPLEGDLQRVAWNFHDPSRQEWFSQIQQYISTPEAEDWVTPCLVSGAAIFVPEITEEWLQTAAISPAQRQFFRDLELTSLITVPLRIHDRCSGLLTFCCTSALTRRYTSFELKLATDLAQRTALAVDNATLYRTTQEAEQNLRQALIILGEHQQQLRTLQRLSDLLNQRLTNLPELLRVMLEAINEAVPAAEFGLVVLQNPYTGLLEVTTIAGTTTAQLQLEDSFAPGDGLLGEIFQRGGARLVQEATTGFPAALCAVAIESAQVGRLGVLAIGNERNPQAFDQETLNLLVAVGEQAAISLTNAQLITTLEEREERLEVQNQILEEQNAELERQRQQIELQNIRLQEAARLKSQFIATMSHELRTPMNAVIGFSQVLLRQQQLQPQQQDMVNRILSNGKNLLALINDILDLSKIETGRLAFSPETFDLAQLVRMTVTELRSLADQKQLPIYLSLTLTDPLIYNDRLRLRQVLVNLLSNAIKFTQTGHVRITASEPRPDLLVLEVEDTGIGIAEADQNHIFEEFRQIDQSLSKRFPGTGLGLTITNLLVHKMGGAISVTSEVDKGSIFRVELPRHLGQN